jgi:hypothetical protein
MTYCSVSGSTGYGRDRKQCSGKKNIWNTNNKNSNKMKKKKRKEKKRKERKKKYECKREASNDGNRKWCTK